ncbi:MAG: sialate O-acetylesterase [Lachnospiraceae bacterium]|nr:sialate O-acetylesterase [Lachnospiraceae bacterium]
MIRLPSNKKVIVILSALCCLLMVALNLYQKSRRTMDVILFMGQSNMSGANGDASQAPELIKGAGYEYRAITEPERLFVLEEPFGENEHREGALDDREILERRGTLVTSFVNAYYEETGTPVAAVSASRGSSSLNGWLNKGLKEDAAQRLEGAKECLKKEKIRIRHIYMVWFQGEADVNLKLTKEEYKEGLNALVSYMGEQGVEQCFLIQMGTDGENSEYHQAVMQAQLEVCEESEQITLASKLPCELNGTDMKDRGKIHFTQKALNLIGADAGAHTGAWVQEQAETESKR